jgi:hypothetical protein
MFAARCKAKRIPPYLHFLHLVANIDWTLCSLPRTERATLSPRFHSSPPQPSTTTYDNHHP